MYLEFFGFSAPPFELTPDPRFLYLPPGHQEALSTLQYGVMSGKGLTVLTGEAGLGKTTLLRTALEHLHGVATRVITITNPALTRPEFIEVIARSLETPEAIGASKPAVLTALESALRRDQEAGTRAVLIADEAHVMPDELLEEIRLLGNFETASAKLLSIIMVGQPELSERLNEPSLRQLKQRVALRCGLVPFSAAETTAYIDTRLRVVGRSASEVFSPDALDAIHALSRGIPRVINVLCDNALLTAFAAGRHVVNTRAIEEVRKDFDLHVAAPEKRDTPAEKRDTPQEPSRHSAQESPRHSSPAAMSASIPRPPVPAAAVAHSPSHEAVPELAVVAAAPPPRRPHPAPLPQKPPASPVAVAERDSNLFTIYTRRKGFFSKVFFL